MCERAIFIGEKVGRNQFDGWLDVWISRDIAVMSDNDCNIYLPIRDLKTKGESCEQFIAENASLSSRR